jgi:hypothetical protein
MSLIPPVAPENRRFVGLIAVIAFVIGSAMPLIGLVVWLDAHPAAGRDPASHVSPVVLIGLIVGFAGTALTQLWGMLKQEQDRQLTRVAITKAEQDRQLAKEAVATAVDTQTVAAASREVIHDKLDEIRATAKVVERQTNGEMDDKIRNGVAAALESQLPGLIVQVMKPVTDLSKYVADIDKEVHKIKHDVKGLKQAAVFRNEIEKLDPPPEGKTTP